MFGSGKKAPLKALPPATYHPDVDFKVQVSDIPRYPPFDAGLPNVSVARVISTQEDYVKRLMDTGIPGMGKAIQNLAAYVHLLPATPDSFFRGAGGLFRLCIETSYFSYVASQGKFFSGNEGSERRRLLEPKWQAAAAYAGLCCEVGRSLNNGVVTNDRGQVYPTVKPLVDWLHDTQSTRYFIKPPQDALASRDPGELSGVIAHRIIPDEAMEYLITDDRAVVIEMLATISRLLDSYSPGVLTKTVRGIHDQVIQRDLKSDPSRYGRRQLGTHLEPSLLSAMRRLVRSGGWKVNEKFARVHIGRDGAFIFWTTAVPEIVDLLRSDGAHGIPTDPQTLGEILLKAGVLEPHSKGGLWHWIRTPISPKNVYEVVKLAHVGTILDNESARGIQPYDSDIEVDPPVAGSVAHAGDSDGSSDSSSTDSYEIVPYGDAQASPAEASSEHDGSVHPDLRGLELTSGEQTKSSGASTSAANPPSSPSSAKRPAPKDHKPKASVQPTVTSFDDGPPPDLPDEAYAEAIAVEAVDDSSSLDSEAAPAAPTVEVSDTDAIAAAVKRPSLVTVMRKVRDDFNSGRDTGSFWMEHGLALPADAISRHGDVPTLAVTLHDAGAVYIAPGETKRFHNLSHDGKSVRVLILKTASAKAFGFASR